jgi:23S rRNA G2069 N7-methylase RlmK/C1962 C5-methylase RlmI
MPGEEAFFADRPGRTVQGPEAAHRLVRADALVFLDRAAAAGRRWDLIILDPPAFSNSKKMNTTLDLRRDHAELIGRCLALLEKGGSLWFSANPRQFKADAPGLEAALAPRFPGLHVTDLGRRIVDEDFRGKKMPLSFVMEIA